MVGTKCIPPRIVWAIDRLAKALASEGYKSATVTVNELVPTSAALGDNLGNFDFYWNDNGSWFPIEDGGDE